MDNLARGGQPPDRWTARPSAASVLLSGGEANAQSTCGGDNAQSTGGGDNAQSTCGGDNDQSTCGGDNDQSTCGGDNRAFLTFNVAGDKGTAPTLRYADQHKPKEGTYADGNTPAGGCKLGCSVNWFEQHPTFKDAGHRGAVGVRARHPLPRRRRGRRDHRAGLNVPADCRAQRPRRQQRAPPRRQQRSTSPPTAARTSTPAAALNVPADSRAQHPRQQRVPPRRQQRVGPPLGGGRYDADVLDHLRGIEVLTFDRGAAPGG